MQFIFAKNDIDLQAAGELLFVAVQLRRKIKPLIWFLIWKRGLISRNISTFVCCFTLWTWCQTPRPGSFGYPIWLCVNFVAIGLETLCLDITAISWEFSLPFCAVWALILGLIMTGARFLLAGICFSGSLLGGIFTMSHVCEYFQQNPANWVKLPKLLISSHVPLYIHTYIHFLFRKAG